MDLQPLNVDDQIFQKMGDGNLPNLIAQTPYGAGSESQLNEGASLAIATDPGPNGIAQGQNVLQPGQVQQAPSFAASQPVQQGPDTAAQQAAAAEIRRLQDIAFRTAQDKLQAEDRAFLAEIADLPEVEQRLAKAERLVDQTTQVNQWLNQERMTARQRQESAQADLARRQFGFIVAHEAGLPFQNEAVRTALLGARDKAHMKQIAQELVAAMNGGQAAQVKQQHNAGVFAAGGQVSQTPPAKAPAQRSGDLDGLVASRNYQIVNWG